MSVNRRTHVHKSQIDKKKKQRIRPSAHQHIKPSKNSSTIEMEEKGGGSGNEGRREEGMRGQTKEKE